MKSILSKMWHKWKPVQVKVFNLSSTDILDQTVLYALSCTFCRICQLDDSCITAFSENCLWTLPMHPGRTKLTLIWVNKPLPWILWLSCNRNPIKVSQGSKPEKSCPTRQNSVPTHLHFQPLLPEKKNNVLKMLSEYHLHKSVHLFIWKPY
jgi:hypothetical protein